MNNDITREEKIDRYLLGEMSASERSEFEKEMRESEDLMNEVKAQREIAETVQKSGMNEFLRTQASMRLEHDIDRYLLGEMTDEEKVEFERDLQDSKEIKQEFEEQKEIAEAVQRIAMKEFLEKHKKRRIVKRIVWSVSSIAAALMLGIFGFYQYNTASNMIQHQSVLAYADLSSPVSRGDDEIEELMASAYDLIGEDKLADARKKIVEIREEIERNTVQNIIADERFVYEQKVKKARLDELDWYDTLIEMKQGHVFKAKKKLKAIANSGSRFAADARRLLEDL